MRITEDGANPLPASTCYNTLIVMNKNQPIVAFKSGRKERLPPGLSRTQDLEALGYSRTAIRRMVERGLLERVSRGVIVLAFYSPEHRQLTDYPVA